MKLGANITFAVVIAAVIYGLLTNRVSITNNPPYLQLHGVSPTPTPMLTGVPPNDASKPANPQTGLSTSTQNSTPSAIALQNIPKDTACTALKDMIYAYCR